MRPQGLRVPYCHPASRAATGTCSSSFRMRCALCAFLGCPASSRPSHASLHGLRSWTIKEQCALNCPLLSSHSSVFKVKLNEYLKDIKKHAIFDIAKACMCSRSKASPMCTSSSFSVLVTAHAALLMSTALGPLKSLKNIQLLMHVSLNA